MTINVPEYCCTQYQKVTEKDYHHLCGKTYDMVEWFEKTGLYEYAMQHGIYNWRDKDKIKFLKETRGITIVPSENGQIKMEGMKL